MNTLAKAMNKFRFAAALAAMLAGTLQTFALTVNVEREGLEKFPVSIEVAGDQAFAKSLRRNLEISGAFQFRQNAAIRVTGKTGGAISVAGRGISLGFTSRAADSKAARNEARALANSMIEAYAHQKGFALDRIAFVRREGRSAELYTCYPDSYDIRRLTSDGKEAVGPRWKNQSTLFYTGFLGAGPKIYEVDAQSGAKKLRWNFKGLTTGACISPDGSKVAIILSLHGNPELYVINIAANSWTRLTNTKNASEGQPCWSPDGREIVYVSDETRYPQLYIIDVATKQKRRITSKGQQNVDPDWGADGRITYITKRAGQSSVAVLNPREGDKSATLVTQPGSWEHPSWSRDGRHLVASRDNTLFIVDTLEDGDEPRQVFLNPGKWITPSWQR